MITERKLALVLSLLKENPNPKYKLEQYSITPSIAASVLFLAKKDIMDKVVCDLGCGSGRFAIGSALLGAKKVFGVDLDREALKVASSNAKLVQEETEAEVVKKCEWVCEDVKKSTVKTDAVIQFPPFTGDMIFLKKALKIAKNVYSIHKLTENTKRKIRRVCKELGAKVMLEKEFRYKVPWKEGKKIGYDVFLLVAKR